MFFGAGLLHTTTLMWSYNHFSHLFGIFNFWPKLTILHGLYPMHIGQFWPFSKCSHFSNIRCFLKRFLAHNNSNVVVESFFAPFWHFYFFNPNWPFCMGYSPCILANFGHFQNAFISRILGVFWSGFLHTTTLMWSYNHFSHLFGIFNFWPKLTILHGL